jgi:hypothetical protein
MTKIFAAFFACGQPVQITVFAGDETFQAGGNIHRNFYSHVLSPSGFGP